MELGEIAITRDSEANIIFSDDGSTNKKCSCSRMWVLVVHNDFLQVEGYERKGNDVDVENLRRVWKHERQCKFAELANCTSAQIIGTLSSGEKLSQLFHPRNSSDPDGFMCEPPEVFLLFVLSHGESGGKILTDHLKPKHTDENDFILTLETYDTCDVWNSLMDVHLLKSCIKILFFAPCRGLKPELQHDPSNINFEESVDVPTAGFLSSKPNHEDFIIFYATVETTFSNRNELQGTWFVQSICSVLDSLVESEDILLFITKVQNHMCQRTLTDCFKENVGQTPQLHLFASKEIQFCTSHTALDQLYSKNNVSDCLTKPDCRPNERVSFKERDTKRSNIETELMNADRIIFYNWGQEHHRYHRGSALIFHDDPHICHAFSIGESFKNLDYDVKIYSTGDIMNEIGRKSLKEKFEYDGSLVLCVLAQLEETNAGLTFQMGEQSVLLSQILDELSVKKSNHLLGKPKLIFVIDEGTKQDKSKPAPEALSDTLQFSNANAGTCLFIGARIRPDESLTDQLISMLSVEELKSGQLCLQFALAKLIRQISSCDDDRDRKCIKPQLISTLPVLVDFPPLLKPYKPFSKNLRIRFAAGITISVIIFAILLSFLSRADGEKAIAHFPSSFTQVHVSDNCAVRFSDGNSSDQVNAFSINESKWKKLSEKCKATWKSEYREEFISLSLSTVGAFENAINRVKSAAPYTQRHVQLMILFGYDTPGDLQHILKFISALTTGTSKELLLQSCIDIFHRVEGFKQLKGIEVLPFWEIIKNNGLQTELKFIPQLNESQTAVVDMICDNINHSSIIEYHNASNAFLKLDDSTKRFFIPHIISTCYRKNLIVKDFYQYIASMGKVACEGLSFTFLLIKSDYNLSHSQQPLNLRETAANKTDEELCKEVVKNIKHLHYSQLQTAFEKFEEKCIEPKDLQDEVYNYFPELVEDIYKGSSLNGTRLAKFIWSGDRYDDKIACKCALDLTKQMRKYGKLKSFHALVFFTYMSEKYKSYIECNYTYFYAPSIVQEFMFTLRTNSSIYTNLTYLFNAINDTNAILMEHSRSDDANVSYPFQVLFLGFVLHSLKEQALKGDEITTQLFILTEKKFKDMYEPLFDEVTKDYFFQHSQCNSVISPRENDNFEVYFYNVVFRHTVDQFGLTMANSLISRLDRVLANKRFSPRNLQIFCNVTTSLYDEIESNKSNYKANHSEEALAIFLFLDNYMNLLKENKSSNEFLKSYNKCSSTFKNVTELVQWKLDYFLQTWNDPNLQPELLKWHKKFQLSSAWLLPKLVQHVINNNSQNLLELLDLFSVWSNQSYSEPLGICPGLFELSQHAFLHPNSFDNATKEKVCQMVKFKSSIPTDHKRVTYSISYKTFISKCESADQRIRNNVSTIAFGNEFQKVIKKRRLAVEAKLEKQRLEAIEKKRLEALLKLKAI